MVALVAKVPGVIAPEARYVLNWVLAGRFGFAPPAVEAEDRADIALSLAGSDRVLTSPCIGGWGPASQYGRSPKPPTPLHEQTLAGERGLPVIFGNAAWTDRSGSIALSFDLWGTIFWCLARMEELETETRDAHGRFSGAQSFLKQHDLLDSPLADQHVEFLWRRIAELASGLTRKPDHPQMSVTCDVDTPYSNGLAGPYRLARTLAGDLIRRRSIPEAVRSVRNFRAVRRRGDYSLDPNNTFAWMMDRCEERNLRAAFYFISGNSAVDPRYELSNPFIRRLMCDIHRRGHEIGMHASYVTYRDPHAVKAEFANLKATCEALNIHQEHWGNRQHYLRWDMRVTADAISAAGFDYDTSLSFHDAPGFRCGTCHAFPLWSVAQRRPLPVMERPLIAMECSAFAGLGLTIEKAVEKFVALKNTCEAYGGDFVLLWHNSELRTAARRRAFVDVLECCSRQ